MKKLGKATKKICALLASFALIMGVASVNVPCILVFHQPKIPRSMQKYKNNR